MTHGEHDHSGGCCTPKSDKDQNGSCCDMKSKCCANMGKIVTIASVAIAIGALVYAGGKGGSAGTEYKKPKIDVSTLIVGEDTVVAKINGQDVKKSDVAQAIQELGAKIPPENVDKILPAFTEQYINLKLLGDAAVKEGVVKQDDVQAQLASSKDQIVRAAYLRKLFDGKITEDSLKAAYKKKFEDAPMPQEVRARHILVDDETKAKDLIAKINAGESFDKLASENSKDPSAKNGGDLGYFVQSDMVKEFGDVAFTMKKGEVSKTPVKTQFGWHVIKVEDKRERTKPTFEESKQTLEQAVQQELLEAKIAELRKDSKVELLLEAEEAPADAPKAEPVE